MAAIVPTNPKLQFFDNSGNPLAGGTVTVYLAGTTTLATTYQDQGLSSANTNPITLDAAGRCSIWASDANTYKYLVKDSGGATIYTEDNIPGNATSATSVNFAQSGTGAVTRTVQEKLRDVVYVTDFMTAAQTADVRAGTLGEDVTAAVQAAIDTGKTIIFPAGDYKITCGATSPFNYGNSSTPVYRAINIDRSDLTIIGMAGAVIHLYGVDNAAGSEINYAFSTAKNMTLGTLTNIRISGLDFEFDPAGKSGTTYRSFHIVGARGVELSDLYMYSSGTRAGATITLQNCEQVRLRNIRMKNVTQGMNFSYVDDVEFSNIMMDYFSEAIDFDRMVSRCKATNVTFTSTDASASGQCWDMNSVRDSTFKNITAYNCGNVVYVNFKKTTPPTYADYVNNVAVTTYTPSRNITIDGVTMHTCGQAASVIYIGDDADTDAGVLTRDITVRNVHMISSGSIEVRMAINVLLSDITMITPSPNMAAGWACIYALKGSRANAKCSANLRNITVKDLTASQDVIRLSELEYCNMDGLHIENYTVDAVEIVAPPAGSIYSITNSKFLRTVDTVVTGVAVRLSSVTASNIQLGWDNNSITQYTTALSVSSAAGGMMLPSKKIALGQQAYTSGTKRTTVYVDANRTAHFGMVKLAALTAAADASNYVSYNLRNSGTSVCAGSDTGGYTAGTLLDIGFTPPETLAEVAPGSSMYLECTATGTGRTLDGFLIDAHYVEYVKV